MKRIFQVLIVTGASFIGMSFYFVMLYRWMPVPFTPLMVIRCGEQLVEAKPLKMKYDWFSGKKIPDNLKLAVICSEDQNFITHKGFDLEAIDKAIEESKSGRRLRGASTISQQTAKNLFLWPGRSWVRKGFKSGLLR